MNLHIISIVEETFLITRQQNINVIFWKTRSIRMKEVIKTNKLMLVGTTEL